MYQRRSFLFFTIALITLLFFAAGAEGTSCLTISADGDTVTGTDGTCTIITAADFGSATKIGNGTNEAGVFAASKSTLTSITFPYGLTDIGNYAFQGCSNLSGSVLIPDTVTYIGCNSFQDCTGLTGSLRIPDSVTMIGAEAFDGCSGFDGSLILSDSLEIIMNRAFMNCSGFTGSLVIPNSVTILGNQVFKGCSGFNGTLTISDSVTEMAIGIFQDCGFTGTLTIPEGVTVIRKQAFYGCRGFSGDLIIPDSVTIIDTEAFRFCRGFEGTLTLSNNIAKIGNRAFQACSGFTGPLLLPDSLTYIGNEAFMDCSRFTGTLILPPAITYLGQLAFCRCSGLTGTLTFPQKLSIIRFGTFSGCSGLDNIVIPNTVMVVGYGAFEFDGADILVLNKYLRVNFQKPAIRNESFYGNTIYCYSDSYWAGTSGGTEVYFISTVSANDLAINEGASGMITVIPDIAASAAYIPSVTYTSSNTTAAVLADSSAAKGVMTNIVNGISEGISTITITAAQAGSDIFGRAAVPAIPAVTITVAVSPNE